MAETLDANATIQKVRHWLRSQALFLFRQMPNWARDLLWLRTPLERVREYRTCRNSASVVEQLRHRLAAGPGPSIVILPAQTWFSLHFQRPQQMARALASIGSPVVYCEPWRKTHIVSGTQADELRFSGVKDLGERLHLLRWPRGALREMIAAIEPDAVLMLFPALPSQDDVFPNESSSRVIYEVLDSHHLVKTTAPKWKEQHEDWVYMADVLVASADDLLAQLKLKREDALLLPNAVTLADWQNLGSVELSADMEAPRQAERVIAYYGTIAEWFDWPLWIHAAKARPNWSFVLIGPAYDNDTHALRLRAAQASNIYYLGPKPYGELPGYMRYVDVATIPFVLNAITHACSPVKLFEYMAAGKPIVTTAMREVLKYKSVLAARSPEEFVLRLDEAIDKRDDPTYLALLRKEAEENTWESRAQSLVSALRVANERYGGQTRRARLRGNS
jgi:glycosyltransferase involved in cell wall biosynthesis